MNFYKIKKALAITFATLFLYFGVSTMINTYNVKNAFVFIIFFFSSSMMILISMAIIASLIFRKFKKNEDHTHLDNPVQKNDPHL